VPAQTSFDYAIVRVVPRVERDEFLNAGAIVYCKARGYLAARIELDTARLLALAPDLDGELVARHLALIPLACRGGAEAGAIGRLTPQERFHWLVAPRSTVIQTSPAHAGLCGDPAAALERLIAEMVRPRR
jgi:hypothetical protein